MIETKHEHCATCDWLSREAVHTATNLGRTRWFSETSNRDGSEFHWARYYKDTAHEENDEAALLGGEQP